MSKYVWLRITESSGPQAGQPPVVTAYTSHVEAMRGLDKWWMVTPALFRSDYVSVMRVPIEGAE